MADEPRQDQQDDKGGTDSTLNRDSATALTTVLESAAGSFPSAEETDIRFSVALVGEMGKDEFDGMTKELPVVAGINLYSELGTKAALLTDVRTATSIAGFVSGGDLTPKDALSDDDLVTFYDGLTPIVEALAADCEEATGYALGAIENVEVVDLDNPPPMIEELSAELADRLCRAMFTLTIGGEECGKFVLALPYDLAQKLIIPRAMPEVASVSPVEAADLQEEEEPDSGVYESEQAELQQAEIDALLAQATGEAEPEPEPAPPPAPAAQPAARPAAAPGQPSENVDLILDIQLRLTARLGQMEMPVGEIMKLSPGSVIDIDRFVDEPVELVVNDRPIARGDIVVVQENFGIKIIEIISPTERIQSLK